VLGWCIAALSACGQRPMYASTIFRMLQEGLPQGTGCCCRCAVVLLSRLTSSGQGCTSPAHTEDPHCCSSQPSATALHQFAGPRLQPATCRLAALHAARHVGGPVCCFQHSTMVWYKQDWYMHTAGRGSAEAAAGLHPASRTIFWWAASRVPAAAAGACRAVGSAGGTQQRPASCARAVGGFPRARDLLCQGVLYALTLAWHAQQHSVCLICSAGLCRHKASRLAIQQVVWVCFDVYQHV